MSIVAIRGCSGATTPSPGHFCPEIVLLYKAGESSPKNDSDVSLIREQLTEDQIRWLRDALHDCYDKHPWIQQLSQRFK
jgi:hypothetical protein